MSARIQILSDWALAQEAIYDEPSSTSAIQEDAFDGNANARPSFQQHRLRSMSLSLPWRRKSSIFHIEPELSSHLEELSLERSRSHVGPSNENSEKHGHGAHAGGNGGNSNGSIKGMFRRASISLKGIVHHHKRHSIGGAHGLEEPRNDVRPGTAHANSHWHRLRQATSFRHSKTSHGPDSQSDASASDHCFPCLPLPGSGSAPPIIPFHTGAAAKASAAASNQAFQNKWLRASSDDFTDRESGIGITVTGVDSDVDVEVEVQDANISRINFIAQLPVELAIQVLAHLDATALGAASRVSREWQQMVKNQHVWRESFLREKTGTYATSLPVQPGTGQGVPPINPDVNWKQIYKAKEELDQRWKEGKAKPVYLNGHLDSIYCLQFDETKIITGSRDKTIRVWDMRTFECRLVIGPPEVVNDVSLLLDDEGQPVHYATLPDNQRANPSMPAMVSFPTHHKASILCLQYDDRMLVTGSSDASCIVYNVRSGYRPIRRLQHHTAAVLDLAFDDKHIITCSKDISICVWDRATGTLLRQLRGHSGPVNAVQMRGNTIVSCSGDFRVKLWNIDTGKNIREFQGHTKGLACSQFSEDGRYVASAGNDKVIRIWDANTGECLREMKAHDNLVRSLHIDSVSGRLVSGSYDTDIKVFDMETGRQLLDFPRWHASWVLSAKSDYRRIVSTGQDPKILIMDFGADVAGIEALESSGGTCEIEGGYI
ncbi:WD repeat domain-containing protein [Colletotrichum abscissum]|uniref:WD repeat domain-containing protein n=1 Tax=Colletotrichum abscissum TaxID=1671311 RepID=A0A9P9XC07_9PEZI|nr:WD repeat domain-containing protein [Colletotrichum abscissum]KAI3547445.1 WD repeat domain-containing protein [Colletotrichum abscissum]KAK1494944.1 WD repeat domain-containing protein [Colletotrichum abscissum]